MPPDLLLYGATGYVGKEIARLALAQGLHPLLAGRDPRKLRLRGAELGLEYCAFELSDSDALNSAVERVPLVLNCAGPFLYTFKPMMEACLRAGKHYVDITGEIPVFEAAAARDAQARERGIMLLPGAGIEIVPTDCLAMYLKGRLPTATHLALGFITEGPAALPPGTFKTMLEHLPGGGRVRRDGGLVDTPELAFRIIDYGTGPVNSIRLPWPDVMTAYYSTGIPNIEDYSGWPDDAIRQMKVLNRFRRLFKLHFVRELFKRGAPPASTPEQRADTRTFVWGEVTDDQGRRAVTRLRGPEAGVIWTGLAALTVVKRVLAGDFRPGFMTPALAYGPDLVLDCSGVTREDVI